MSSMQDIRYKYSMLSIAEKLIVINVAVFIVHGLTIFLSGLPDHLIIQWFQLPKDLSEFIIQPWSLVTYSFFHGGFFHILFNMMVLYFSGRIFLNLFQGRTFLNVYFLGVIAGGLFFLISYNLFPVFQNTNTALIGASAGVYAVLIFICTYLPKQEVRVFFFNLKLWQLGAFLVVLNLLLLPNGNAGGRLAHLGGALLGFMYARKLGEGKDIGAWFGNGISAIINTYKPRKKSPLRTVHKKQSKSSAKTVKKVSVVKGEKNNHQQKIDDILDKISKSGYESLSKAEKDYLFQAGKD
ncbi:rhomboid family intramembrane serine protease [Ascidiimonas sp. W6]|uniref:rhomboid family intramembrane serine protease n=1 Tax=Ascidiimonas meishanensis TaxID=3128903 RepID=UPI0030EB23DC